MSIELVLSFWFTCCSFLQMVIVIDFLNDKVTKIGVQFYGKLMSTLGSNRTIKSLLRSGVSSEVLLQTFSFQEHTIEQTGVQG